MKSFKHKKTQTALALFNQICYIKDTKRTTATKWLASLKDNRNTTPTRQSLKGGFSMLITLSDKRKYECQ